MTRSVVAIFGLLIALAPFAMPALYDYGKRSVKPVRVDGSLKPEGTFPPAPYKPIESRVKPLST